MRERGPDYTIYTDGGADPNPGPGGWGAVILRGNGSDDPDAVRELSGAAPSTTNNRMELSAALEALRALPEPASVALYTDSTYLRNGVTQWLPGWVRRGWKRKGGALKNVDLWRALAEQVARHDIDWHWVKGHTGDRWNERADTLASAAIPGRAKAGDGAGEAAEAPDVEVFLAVSSHGGGGAWAAIVRTRDGAEETYGAARRPATGPQLEILGAAETLERLPSPASVAVHTPSDYLRNGASRWLHAWKRGGWATKAGHPVKNRKAWERLDAQLRRHRVRWPVPAKKRGGDPPPEAKRLQALLEERLG